MTTIGSKEKRLVQEVLGNIQAVDAQARERYACKMN